MQLKFFFFYPIGISVLLFMASGALFFRYQRRHPDIRSVKNRADQSLIKRLFGMAVIIRI